MRAHILHHTPFETAGSIPDWFAAHNAHVTETRFYEREFYPELDGLDVLVVMGGMMSANDEASAPWLAREKTFLRDAIAHGVPTLGICLGSQLIASALGARVYRNAFAEHGWFAIDGIAHGENAFRFPERFTTFESHGDTFDLPAGAVQLARTDSCERQAFQFGTHVIALQFHLESNPESAGAIIKGCVNEFTPGPFVQSHAQLHDAPRGAYEESRRLMGDVLSYLTNAQR